MFPTVFHNFSGRDYPDYSRKTFDSLVVENGFVVDQGFGLETISRYEHHTKLDLGETVLFPAFTDSHVHFLQTGLTMIGCDLSGTPNIEAVLARLEKAANDADGEWLVAWNLDETNLEENRFPSIEELDGVTKGKNLWIHRVDLHSAIPNTRTIDWASRFKPDSGVEGGRYLKADYPALWCEILAKMPKESRRRALESARRAALKNGVTAVHALEGGWGSSPEDVAMIGEFLREPGFHGIVYHQSEDPALAEKMKWPRLGGCLLVDGSFGSRTAALTAPYSDDPETSGVLYRDAGNLEKLIDLCFDRHLQLAMHAIGDRAIEVLVRAHLHQSRKHGPPPLQHRIEHFELPSDQAILNAREARLLISVQPAFEALWGGGGRMYERRLGPERVKKTNPFRTLLDRGIPIAGGSDSPVTPIDPMLGIHGFLNHPTPDERIGMNSAFEAFVFQPHRFSGEFTTRGRLKKGYVADLNCFEKDPFLVPPGEIRNIHPCRTFIGGSEFLREKDKKEP